jgi:hypothetical protein
VTVSIDGFRLIANSDENYNGQAGPYWATGAEGPWTDIPPVKPYAARVGVYRKGQSEPTWGVAKFDDYNARSPMWSKFPSTMISKCAEMLALRKALPGKLSGIYGVEEMDQATEPKKAAKGTSPDVLFGGRIRSATTLADLQAVGKDITASSLGLDSKMQLNVEYMAKKKELGAEGVEGQ